ncbi:MAG: hypothetical protein ACI4W6_10210 [Acutalibacteraceae bacterium]
MSDENNTDPKDFLDQTVTVQIDRPLGSRHPEHNYIYPLNYGYLANTVLLTVKNWTRMFSVFLNRFQALPAMLRQSFTEPTTTMINWLLFQAAKIIQTNKSKR